MAESIVIALITAGFPTLTTAITTAQDVYITRIVGIGGQCTTSHSKEWLFGGAHLRLL